MYAYTDRLPLNGTVLLSAFLLGAVVSIAYFSWLGAIVVSYCVLTQLLKRVYIRRFGNWL